MLTYTSLLYEDLVRQGALTPGGRLPPVLPLVLYNDPRPWQADLESLEDLQVMLRERVIQWTQEWKEEGLRAGLQKGRIQGRAEGERRLLRRLLERRFGALPDRWARTVEEAGEEQLLRWSERVLDAQNLEEVFA